jgi:hypothetical protein
MEALETSKGKLPKDKDVTLTALGFVNSAKAAVYSEPGYENIVMDSVIFCEHFFIQDIMKSFSKRTQGYHNEWYQIVYPDLRLGWINKRDFKQSEVLVKVVNDTLRLSDFFDKKTDLAAITAKRIIIENGRIKEQLKLTELSFDVHSPSEHYNLLDNDLDSYFYSSKWVHKIDVEVFNDANMLYLLGESGARILWDKARRDTLYDTRYNYHNFKLTRNWILDMLSYYSQKNKRMWEAIEYQEKRIELNPDDADPFFQIAHINIRLKKSKEALDYYLQILEKFPDNIVYGFEHTSTVHLDAVSQIKSLFNNKSQDFDYHLKAYDKVKKLTKSDIGYFIATNERLTIFRQNQDYDLLIEEANSALDKYPAVTHWNLNYSFLMMYNIFRIYFYDYYNPKQALDYCLDIRDQKLDSLLTISTIFLEAKVCDETNGSRKIVSDLYEKFLNEKTKKDDYYYMHSLNLNQGGYNSSYNDMLLIIAQKRLKAINTFETRVGYIKSENISIFESPDSLSAVTYNPKFNEEVNVLYPITKNDSIWYKIQTGDSLIAWVPKHNIVVEKIDEPEITEKNIKKQNYDTYNSQLPKVKAKKEKPSIIKKFLIFFNLYTETQIKIILTLIILLIAILFIVAVIKRRK